MSECAPKITNHEHYCDYEMADIRATLFLKHKSTVLVFCILSICWLKTYTIFIYLSHSEARLSRKLLSPNPMYDASHMLHPHKQQPYTGYFQLSKEDFCLSCYRFASLLRIFFSPFSTWSAKNGITVLIDSPVPYLTIGERERTSDPLNRN